MTPLFRKLNLKDQCAILVLNAPESFEAELSQLAGVSVLRKAADAPSVSFAIIFAQRASDIATGVSTVIPRTEKDPIIWFAYPKGTSKRYRCEFNRDTGWEALGQAGFEPVRQVAIDADWSALRFRRAEHIKTMTRDPVHRMSSVGKARAQTGK